MDRKELVTILSTDMSKHLTLYVLHLHKEAGGYGFGNRSMDLMRSVFDRRLNNKNKNNKWPHK